MIRQKELLLLGLLFIPALLVSCSDDDDDDLIGYWVRMSDFDGLARGEASGFTIGNKGYLIGGFNGNRNSTRMSDLWVYDMDMDAWTQLADCPGSARSGATAFAIEDKGYLGTGYNYTNESGETYLNDFWEYDPASNVWTQKADFPGSARYDVVSFSVDGKGYIGAGYDGNYLKDFYSYDPQSNIWTQMRDITDTSDDDYDDEYVSIIRAHANTFVIDNVAYLTCGENGSLMSYTWKYYPDTDLWEEVHSFKGSARTQAVSFSNGEKGFVATGKSGTSYFDDIWILRPYEYDPDDE